VVCGSSITNWSKELTFRKLNEKTESDSQVTLARDRETMKRYPDEILVGDVIYLNYGDMMKVDGIILEADE